MCGEGLLRVAFVFKYFVVTQLTVAEAYSLCIHTPKSSIVTLLHDLREMIVRPEDVSPKELVCA